MNRPITGNEIESVILKLPTNKSRGPDDFHRWILPITYPSQTIQKKLQRKEHFHIHCMRTTALWYHIQGKTSHKKENCRPISLMNIDVKILEKILASRIHQHIKKLIRHDQVGFISGMQRLFNIYKSISVIYHINKLKGKNHMTISIDAEKAFEKIQHHVWLKLLKNGHKTLKTLKNLPQHSKGPIR